jgi:hypothetical protein
MGPQITNCRDIYTTVSNYFLIYILYMIISITLLSFNLDMLNIYHIVKRPRKAD